MSHRCYQPGEPSARQPPSPPGDQLSAYDPRWPRIFAAERQRIRAALGPLALGVEHVGSSAIPGLWGRSEIDVLVGVGGGDVRTATRLLTAIGYVIEDRAPPEAEPWSLLSRRGQIPFELLLVEHHGPLWRRHLWLRDYLRRDPARAIAYGRLKSGWAARYGAGTRGYKQAKRRFWGAVQEPGDRS
ncbi:MAG: GrpB family protein [Actinomycetota bacterium]|nr:GrpB family protein [Actinomycetota bacterium]